MVLCPQSIIFALCITINVLVFLELAKLSEEFEMILNEIATKLKMEEKFERESKVKFNLIRWHCILHFFFYICLFHFLLNLVEDLF